MDAEVLHYTNGGLRCTTTLRTLLAFPSFLLLSWVVHALIISRDCGEYGPGLGGRDQRLVDASTEDCPLQLARCQEIQFRSIQTCVKYSTEMPLMKFVQMPSWLSALVNSFCRIWVVIFDGIADVVQAVFRILTSWLKLLDLSKKSAVVEL
eukprot:TRINITY_DN50809_c0_g1_i1.p1 TRINITY_DN50809_c0_g1~~TRINITY_DN50809_c0_g1_i1.p1  ORF type:complete len:171 (-),score=18.46 TRINITY_DN50809_c0_g1_i1:39-491(-)